MFRTQPAINKIMGLKDWFKSKAAEIAEQDKERKMRLERDIIMALRQVYDPEIPVNVYDLGLIYGGDLTILRVLIQQYIYGITNGSTSRNLLARQQYCLLRAAFLSYIGADLSETMNDQGLTFS